MPIERRTRVEIFLPLRSDTPAYQIAVDWLAQEFAFQRGGATLTTPFAGLFYSPTQVNVVEDAIRVLSCDFELDSSRPDHRSEIVSILEKVKKFLKDALEEEEVWMVFYPIERIAS